MPFALALASSAALRVASLDLCADEYLLMLGRDDQIASVSRVGRDPRDSVLAIRARHFAANDGTIESVLSARPTLLLSSGGGGGRSTQALAARFGVRAVKLPYAATIDDVAANVTKVARLLGNPEASRRWQVRLQRLRRSLPPARDAAFLSGAGMSQSPEGIGAEWMRLAGLRQRTLPGARMTLERLVIDPPSVLLISRYWPGQASMGQRWLSHPIVQTSRSRKLGADGRRWTCAGPLMLDEVERLRRRP